MDEQPGEHPDGPADGRTARRRRHARTANSVSVAELLAKSTPDEQASMSAIQARAAAEVTTRIPPVLPGRVPDPAMDFATRPLPPVRGYHGGDGQRSHLGHPARDESPHHDDPGSPDSPDPSDEVDGEEEPRSSGRLARTIAVTLVAMVVTGVVTAVAAIGGEPPRRLAPSVPVVQPASMVGPAVLRLSVVIDSLSLGSPEVPAAENAVPAPTGSTPGQPEPTTETTAGLLVGSGEPAQPGASDTSDAAVAAGAQPSGQQPTSRPAAPTVDRERAESVVLDFYEALPRQTAYAFGLLSPEMQDDGQEAFDAAWRRANAVNPRILPSDDGKVRASISVSRFNDSEVTRLIVRLDVRPVRVDGAARLLIVGAELLSAHRS